MIAEIDCIFSLLAVKKIGCNGSNVWLNGSCPAAEAPNTQFGEFYEMVKITLRFGTI